MYYFRLMCNLININDFILKKLIMSLYVIARILMLSLITNKRSKLYGQ